MHEFPVKTDHVGKQSFGEPVLAHHMHRFGAAFGGEFQVAVARDHDEPVAFHPRDGL